MHGLVAGAPKPVVDTLKTQNVTINLHAFGLLESTFTASAELQSQWHVLATNLDRSL